jgi:hypothetical protein
MDAKKRERIDSQVMTALNRGETSRKRISHFQQRIICLPGFPKPSNLHGRRH